MSRPPWNRDEVILALDLYMRSGRRLIGPRHPDVVELSKFLNSMPINLENRTEKYRNPSGVGLKLANLRSLDPTTESVGLRSVSAMDREVWDEFADNPQSLEVEVRRIRNSV